MQSKIEQVSKYIEQIGWGRYNFLSFFICGLSWSTMLMWQGCISISLKQLKTDWSLTNMQLGLIGSCHTLGVLIGSLLWGYLGDSKGRLKSLRQLFFLYSISGGLYTFSLSLSMICISGILLGICNGGAQVLTGTLYLETLPTSKKWTLVLLTICISLGGIFAYFCAIVAILANIEIVTVWRFVGIVNVVVMIVIFLLLRQIYESPKFLVSSNQDLQACEVLEKIAKQNKKNMEIKIYTDVEYVFINGKQINEPKQKAGIADLFSSAYLSQTMLITIGLLLSDISYAALLAFMPILLTSIGSNIRSQLEIYITILIQTIMGVPGSLLSAYLSRSKIGKKWTIFLGFVLCGLSVLLFLASNQYWMVLVSTCCINLFNQMGYSSFIAFTAESYSVELRALGVGWANAWCKFGGVLSPITIGFIFGIEGGIVFGVLLISFCFCLVGVIALFLKENKLLYRELD